jgi:preprotein translocase subunit SecG
MAILQFILIAVTVISSILLLILILLQKTKADGLGLAFGSGVGEALFGSRAGNILSKLTITFACVFLASTLLLSMLFAGGRGKSLMRKRGVMAGSVERVAPQGAAPSVPSEAPAAAGGAPTLPGTDLGDQGNQPRPAAPAKAPDPQSAPVPVPTPAGTPAQ